MSRFPAPTDYDGWVAQLGNSERRQWAKAHLREAGSPATAAVRRGLRHRKPIVRQLCASILDRLADDASLGDLVAALDDPDPAVVRRALHTLACDRCKETECRPGEDLFVPKALALLVHSNVNLRAGAIDTLGNVAGHRVDVAAALAETAKHDPDPRLRAMARQRVPLAGLG